MNGIIKGVETKMGKVIFLICLIIIVMGTLSLPILLYLEKEANLIECIVAFVGVLLMLRLVFAVAFEDP